MSLESHRLRVTSICIARHYDGQKYGREGVEGYRKSTDLMKLVEVVEELARLKVVNHATTVFLDLGCADGRVNVLLSYRVKRSLGIEIDPLILQEYAPRKRTLLDVLVREGLPLPPDNIHVLVGNSLDTDTHQALFNAAGVRFSDVDLFYTYITLHDLFGEMIASHAKKGAHYLVYGFNKVLPRYEGLELVIPDVGSQSIAALYRKT